MMKGTAKGAMAKANVFFSTQFDYSHAAARLV
jgi:hypothetical protein